MPMNRIQKRTFLSLAVIVIGLTGWLRSDDSKVLPPVDMRADWAELEKLQFTGWKIKEFHGWAVPFDGGSKVSFFETDTGERFDVMAANPAYWTAEDKKALKQVFYLIHKNQFYRIEPESEQEKLLVKMITDARPELKGTERKDPALLDGLVARLSDRKPMFRIRR